MITGSNISRCYSTCMVCANTCRARTRAGRQACTAALCLTSPSSARWRRIRAALYSVCRLHSARSIKPPPCLSGLHPGWPLAHIPAAAVVGPKPRAFWLLVPVGAAASVVLSTLQGELSGLRLDDPWLGDRLIGVLWPSRNDQAGDCGGAAALDGLDLGGTTAPGGGDRGGRP